MAESKAGTQKNLPSGGGYLPLSMASTVCWMYVEILSLLQPSSASFDAILEKTVQAKVILKSDLFTAASCLSLNQARILKSLRNKKH